MGSALQVPKHPALPLERKRSNRTADIRHRRFIARRLYRNFMVQYAMDFGMNAPWPDLAGIREFKFKCDPVTGIVTEVEAEANEAEAAMSMGKQIQAANLIQAEMPTLIRLREDRQHAERSQKALPPPSDGIGDTVATARVAPPSPSPAISQAFADWAEDQVSDSVCSKETCAYTHEPSNRLFRELVGELAVPPQEENLAEGPTVDPELARLTPARMTAGGCGCESCVPHETV